MKIVYWSGTGNTEQMAELIKKGIEISGKTADLVQVSEANINNLLKENTLILGCPAMGDEALEEGEFEPFINELCKNNLAGKKAALFGSYGWGDGQWMRDFAEKMTDSGCSLITNPLIINESPDGSENECMEFSKKIVQE